MTTDTVHLPGLDGSNPLGFLAALGVLRITNDCALREGRARPRLSWTEHGTWFPVLRGAGDLERVIDMIVSDLAGWEADPGFLLAYDGERLVDPRTSPKATQDLKPPPAVMREFLERIASLADEGSAGIGHWAQVRRSMDTVAAYGSEVVQDNQGKTKPLALHFTAGQQQFLRALTEIQRNVTAADFREAMSGPWQAASTLPSMSWDATVARIYSLRAGDPSKEKRGSSPGADWLAFVGIGLLLSTPLGGRLETTGVRGGWKTGRFTWPIWSIPIEATVVRSLLSMAAMDSLTAVQRRLRGISTVFSSGITRADQGGYGAFTPAEMR